ncbi:hypothetical protein [Tritonibacter mobilis]|uniref:hypothetical protein n=1 Tax=Alphaproteobacteria TaxID=28211 RepID=UPI000806C4B2|nr:hypothetical protein [Tritonibacter mobilis]
MKMLTIKPCEKPASFADEKFTQADWQAAWKLGPKTVPAVTAMEAVRNSKGMYQIHVEEQETVKVELQGLKAPEQMSPSELVAEMTSHGKPPRKKMDRKTAVAFVKDLREKAEAFIVDDEEGGSE